MPTVRGANIQDKLHCTSQSPQEGGGGRSALYKPPLWPCPRSQTRDQMYPHRSKYKYCWCFFIILIYFLNGCFTWIHYNWYCTHNPPIIKLHSIAYCLLMVWDLIEQTILLWVSTSSFLLIVYHLLQPSKVWGVRWGQTCSAHYLTILASSVSLWNMARTSLSSTDSLLTSLASGPPLIGPS